MRGLAFRVLVLALVCGLTPGLFEAAENLWHLAAAGHAAHTLEQGEGHAPEGDEHGCSGTFHLCSCHHTVPSALLPVISARPAAEPPIRASVSHETPVREPDLARLDRPPRA